MQKNNIPFNLPFMTGGELAYISQAHSNGKLSGDGPFTKKCHRLLEEMTASGRVLLTHSCTSALEMCAYLINIKPGDEVIMPSYTFVSTANAFAIRGAKPVFVDVREDTLNLDESLVEAAITNKTKAIVPVHYAGVACEMDSLLRIGEKYNLSVIEDAAQGAMARYRGRSLGAIGNLGTYSFHETKNIISGEGGALLVNDGRYLERAEIIREKGTDRSKFMQGLVDKYTWQDYGSSYLPGEIIAAFLYAQLENALEITKQRMQIWNFYHRNLAELEDIGLLRRPIIPRDCEHNAHMYYILLPTKEKRDFLLRRLNLVGIGAIFHYVPLHSSPAGERVGRVSGGLEVTNSIAGRILRLPLWVGIKQEQLEYITSELKKLLL
jgi:dTDP-4-amino-4,6-dideoxygalactose transaminase